MSYKSILVHLADVQRAPRLLEAAVPVARQMQAHLIGLVVMPPFVVIPAADGTGMTVSVDQHREAYQADMTQLKAMFEKATAGETFQSEWREADAAFATAAGSRAFRLAFFAVATMRSPASMSACAARSISQARMSAIRHRV